MLTHSCQFTAHCSDWRSCSAFKTQKTKIDFCILSTTERVCFFPSTINTPFLKLVLAPVTLITVLCGGVHRELWAGRCQHVWLLPLLSRWWARQRPELLLQNPINTQIWNCNNRNNTWCQTSTVRHDGESWLRLKVSLSDRWFPLFVRVRLCVCELYRYCFTKFRMNLCPTIVSLLYVWNGPVLLIYGASLLFQRFLFLTGCVQKQQVIISVCKQKDVSLRTLLFWKSGVVC